MKLPKSIRYWLLSRQKPCCDLVKLMSESLDRPLSVGDKIELRLHMLVCAWCARYLQHIRNLRSTLRRTPATTDHILSDAARKRIAEALAASDDASEECSPRCKESFSTTTNPVT